MPRRSVPFVPGQYYHFYNRGNNRQAVFFERDNYLYFLKGLKKYLLGEVDVIAYSLLPTHYHILGKVRGLKNQTSEVLKTSEVLGGRAGLQTSEVLETSDVSGERRETSEVLQTSEVSRQVSLAMQKFGISYTKAINKRFARVGALFQGQFQGKPVRNYEHLLNLCIYIHANPVKDGLAALPEEWEFSNYREWMNLRPGTLVNREFISDNFGTPAEYQELVRQYVKTRFLPEDVRKYLQELEN